MRRCYKTPGSRHGATTMFLAIILTAVILIECTYVILVANLDRGMTLMRAASLQVDTYLAQYDRQLLKTYGVYAFNPYVVDDVVFDNVMTANGIEDGQTLVVSGMETFDTDDLRSAISTFYAYRGTGIIINTFSGVIDSLLEEFNATGILDKMRSFTSSDASTALGKVFDGSTNVAQSISENSEESDIEYDTDSFDDLIDSYDNLIGGSLRPDDDYDPSDIGFIYDCVSFLSDFNNSTSDVIDDYLFHPVVAHYAAYNFDCALEDDSAIDGTSFTEFHSANRLDAEYILTGLEGDSAGTRVNIYCYIVLFINRIIDTYNDSSARTIIDPIALILSLVISALTLGTVSLPDSVYRVVIIVIYSAVKAKGDLDSLLEGEKVSIGSYGSFSGIDMGYRDFIFLFMMFKRDSSILEGIRDVLLMDFPDYAVEVEVTAFSNTRSDYIVRKGYELYEDA